MRFIRSLLSVPLRSKLQYEEVRCRQQTADIINDIEHITEIGAALEPHKKNF
jgi:hypothetical protein